MLEGWPELAGCRDWLVVDRRILGFLFLVPGTRHDAWCIGDRAWGATYSYLDVLFVERRVSLLRIAGLVIALLGLVLVVSQNLINVHLSFSGMVYALLSLGSMTVGAILQKRIQQSPEDILPLQYLVSLVLCLIFLPFKPYHVEWVLGFLVPWLWLGLIISVVAQLLLYRMIKAGNLVNVTSLFYLVPVVTAVMDYIFLGNVMPVMSMLGMVIIIIGLVVTFRHAN